MLNDPVESPASPLRYDSALEREIVETLVRTLPSPWKLQQHAPLLDVPAPGLDFPYTPDIVIKNESTGQSLSVEVKSSVSLSLLNIMTLQRIQSAIEKLGGDFLLLVQGEAPGSRGAKPWLSEYGINAVGVSQAADAAGEIEKQLARPSRLLRGQRF
jgi:hypothetical protein